ncbi:MAG: response regulator [Candidatus Aminicenantes bacterium]|nr:response regulator [Candidatus Aminicenantes bacterium]
MSKKTIVLADNSYTIRRIVELSFSEEEEIGLVSFEDGANLKEKLLELKPEIVLVDIKLPEFNGYEVCKFINTSEELKHTKVFLMKGGFEPIDEGLLTNLRYATIITKPFDSNALVATIKKMLSAPQRTPSTVPEQTPAAPGMMPGIEAGSVGGIPATKEDFGARGILDDKISPAAVPYQPMMDDVQPSEEITQGTQPEVDTLAPTMSDDMANPFNGDLAFGQSGAGAVYPEEVDIKQNIHKQESDLDVGSFTQEALQIQQNLDKQDSGPAGDQLSFGGQLGAEAPDIFAGQAADIPGVAQGAPVAAPVVDGAPAGTSGQMFAGEEIAAPMQGGEEFGRQAGAVGSGGMESQQEVEEVLDHEQINLEQDLMPDAGDAFAPIEQQPPFADSSPAQEMQQPAAFESPVGVDTPAPEAAIPGASNEVGGLPMDSHTAPTMAEEFQVPGMEQPASFEEAPAVEPPLQTGPAADMEIPPRQEAAAGGQEEDLTGIPAVQKEQIMHKVEDKLAIAIKEILWDVVPPMAEKIIKNEIEKLKTEVDESFGSTG